MGGGMVRSSNTLDKNDFLLGKDGVSHGHGQSDGRSQDLERIEPCAIRKLYTRLWIRCEFVKAFQDVVFEVPVCIYAVRLERP